jgi:hypothetical protein
VSEKRPAPPPLANEREAISRAANP